MSGEDSSIPRSELEALVRIYNPNPEMLSVGKRLVKLENIRADTIDTISRRGAYVTIGGRFVTSFHNESSDKDFDKIDFGQYIRDGDGYAIRVMGTRDEDAKMKLETTIGSAIRRQHSGAKARLSDPDILFWGRVHLDRIYLGCTRYWAQKKGWNQRRGRSKPFFHASALYPKFARALVNLTMVRERDMILDPFCGTGTIIQEASMMNIEAIGLDLEKRMCSGASRNLKSMDLKKTSIVRSDSTLLPMKSADGIATDLPYGRCSSTKGKTLSRILDSFLLEMCRVLAPGKKGTIVYPKGVDLILPSDLVMTQTHEIVVHRHLTRVVAVLERR
ncbi:MAG: DNA methyltransferase [Nitrososphaerales archaeon]